jgi:tetratricopeptide (TPR) repeat protein
MSASAYALLTLVPLVLHAPAPVQDGPWAGKTVILKESGVRMGHWKENGGDKAGIELREATQLVVIEDREGFLKVRQDGKSGWIPKDKAVLAEDAVDFFGDLIKKHPGKAEYYNRRAEALGYKKDWDKALEDLNEAIRLNPKDHSYWINRAAVFGTQNKLDKALEDAKKAIELKSTEEARALRGTLYLAQAAFDNAIEDFNEAIRLNPNYAPAYTNRGITYFNMGEYKKALLDYEATIRVDPEEMVGYNNKADLLASCPDPTFRDGAKAVELAKKACELSKWKAGIPMDTLACAYAETGQFDEAVKWIKKALEQDDYRKHHDETGKLRLKCFAAGKPYHYGDTGDE